MRVVLDTDVVVAALRSPTGASAAILMAALDKRVMLVANVPLVIEYEATCRLAEHRIAAGLNEREVKQFLDAVVAMIEPVETHFLWRPRLRDPADEMVLEAAVNGRATAIVTFNTRDYGKVPNDFGVEVLLPRDVLRRFPQ
ncbi:MAG: putative toxin-antitoxin system toxin component, PIN family [Gammaproteobacteria bacterium]